MVSLWNKIPIKCLFVRELNIYIGFWSLRWRPLNMGFVDKGPSKSAMVFLLFVLSISQAWWASNFDEHQKILNMMASWLRNVGPMRFDTSFIAAPTRCQCQTLVVLVNLSYLHARRVQPACYYYIESDGGPLIILSLVDPRNLTCTPQRGHTRHMSQLECSWPFSAPRGGLWSGRGPCCWCVKINII